MAYLTSAVAGPKPTEQYHSSELYVFTGRGEYENIAGTRLEDVTSRVPVNFMSSSLRK